MSDISNARIDYPHVPRALLEMLDFYGCEKVNRPYINPGKRNDFVAYMTLVGADITSRDDPVVVTDPLNQELLLGIQIVYLIDLNKFFKRIHS